MGMELVSERLESEDKIEKTYYVRYEGKGGTLMMSNKKLFFVEEKGFLQNKTYDLVLEIPYEKVRKIAVEGTKDNQLTITEVEGRKHIFMTPAIRASVVEKSFGELMPRPVMP